MDTSTRDNEMARGGHSCGPNCQRPLCVANRKIERLDAERDELKQRIAELENDNQELANAIEETDKLNSERIAELEDRNTALTESENYAMAKASRLDAALKEISLGVVAPMDFAKKAREGE